MTRARLPRPRGAARATASRLLDHVAVLPVVARQLAASLIDGIEAALLRILALCSWRRRRELARLERDRPREPGRWFTARESAIVGALASLIVPSDEDGPGANEADVVAVLDHEVSASAPRQSLYARGLLACDEWARREHGRTFVTLTPEQQLALLRHLDGARARWARAGSTVGKIRGRVVLRFRAWHCPLFDLWPRLVRDVLDAFYTSQVCWDWLGYDGPPMPHGYPDLLARDSLSPPPTRASSQGARH